MSTGTDTTTTDDRRRHRRVAVLKFGLAGAALLGIAAAATSAAWSDQAWFRADATGARIELQGQNFDAPPTYADADGGPAGTIAIPSDELANLVEGEKREFTLSLKNTGSAPLSVVGTPTWVSGGSDFQTPPTAVLTGVPTTLAADAEVTVTVTVTTPGTWDVANQGKSEPLQIVFTGTATPTVSNP